MPEPLQLELFTPRDVRPDPRRGHIIEALNTKERWRVDEAAYFLRCSERHILYLIEDGTLTATNIARLPDSRPCYRLYRDQIHTFERSRREGASETQGVQPK
jgi:hypothetical protein